MWVVQVYWGDEWSHGTTWPNRERAELHAAELRRDGAEVRILHRGREMEQYDRVIRGESRDSHSARRHEGAWRTACGLIFSKVKTAVNSVVGVSPTCPECRKFEGLR